MIYRSDIDGLRAVAVMGVLIYHAQKSLLPGGFTGVDVFFVISGYLITRVILEEIENGQWSLLRFYERRARRILPALAAVILCFFIIGTFISLPWDFKNYGEAMVANLFFLSNLYFWLQTDYFATASEFRPLLHTWSLSVEEQFYVIFPVLLLIATRFAAQKQLIWSVWIGSFCLSVVLSPDHASSSFYLLHTRAWELATGSLLAANAVPHIRGTLWRHATSIVGILLILGSYLFISAEIAFPGWAALLPCLGAALFIHAGANGTTVAGRLLSFHLPVQIGLISYSLYLWHWPILATARQLSGMVELSSITIGICVTLCFVTAYLSWRFVETPFRNKTRVPAKAIWIGSIGSGAVICGLAIVTLMQGGFPNRFSPNSQAWFQDMAATMAIRDRCTNRLDFPDACKFGNESGSVRVMIWGDSHAPSIRPAIDAFASTQGYRVTVANFNACAPVLDPPYGVNDKCQRFAHRLFEALAETDHPIDTVVLSANWIQYIKLIQKEENAAPLLTGSGTGAPDVRAFEDRLAATINELKELGLTVILLGQVPHHPQKILPAMVTEVRFGIPVNPTTPEGADAFYSTASDMLNRVAARTKVTLVDPAALLCTPYCQHSVDGAPAYYDSHHLTLRGGRDLLGDSMLRARVWDGVLPSPRQD